MQDFDFNQKDGLLLVGLPDQQLVLLQALSEKLGSDIPTIMAKSFIFLAKHVLSDQERQELQKKMR
jgi:hypothetical protein